MTLEEFRIMKPIAFLSDILDTWQCSEILQWSNHIISPGGENRVSSLWLKRLDLDEAVQYTHQNGLIIGRVGAYWKSSTQILQDAFLGLRTTQSCGATDKIFRFHSSTSTTCNWRTSFVNLNSLFRWVCTTTINTGCSTTS